MPGQWLASIAGIAALKSGASTLARRLGRQAALMLLVGGLWAVAFAFALAAVTLWLSDHLGIVAACTIVAAALATIGFAVRLGMAADRPPAQAAAQDQPAAGPEPSAAAAEEGAEISDDAVLASALLVSLTGFLLGRMVSKP